MNIILGEYIYMQNTLEQNKAIEDAITSLQKNPCEEILAHTLTVLRKSMQAKNELIIAVNNSIAANGLTLQTVTTDDGKKWFLAFTSFDEQTKGSIPIMSAFSASIHENFNVTLQTPEVAGLIINPWNKTLMLDKSLIQIVIGS